MKYTICGFSQEAALKFKQVITENGKTKTLKLDNTDLTLLRWFVDFYPKMKKKIIGETQYAWVNYKSLVDDLPILSIEKKQVYRRFSKMCKFGILTHYHDKVGGSFSYYSFGSQYTLLIDSDPGIQKSYPGIQKSYPLGLKSPNKDSSININNSSIKYKEEYKEEKIDCQEVADAFNETCVSLPLSKNKNLDFVPPQFYTLYNSHNIQHLGDNNNTDNNKEKSTKEKVYSEKQSFPPPSTEKKESVNYQKIVDSFNKTCTSLPKVCSLTEKRKRAIKLILKKHSLKELEMVFKKVEDSDFLNGNSDKWSGATFDWILKESNFIKVMEGNYDNKIKYNNLHGTPSYDIEGYEKYNIFDYI